MMYRCAKWINRPESQTLVWVLLAIYTVLILWLAGDHSPIAAVRP